MAGSKGSRLLWWGLLLPPLLVLGGTGAMMLWPERIVGVMDSLERSWTAVTTRPAASERPRSPMMRPPSPPLMPVATAMLRGTILTPDGQPFRGKYTLGHSRRQRSMGMHDHRGVAGSTGSSAQVDQPQFAIPLDDDRTFVVIHAEGYAPKVFGPYSKSIPPMPDHRREGEPAPKAEAPTAEVGGDPPPIEVKLEPGFPFEVRVVDDQGTPILGAEVTPSILADHIPVKLGYSRWTDDDGRARFTDISDHQYGFEVNVHAFIHSDDAITPKVEPGGTATITLERGPVAGVARDEEGKPVADAVLLVSAEMDDELETAAWHPFDRIVLARSDADGRFVLPALHQNSTYLIRADGPGGSLGFAPGVRRGGGEVQITLRPLRTVRGVVEADAAGRRPWISVHRSVPTGFKVRGHQPEGRSVMPHNRGFQPDPEGRFEYPAWGSVDSELVVGGRPIPVPWPPPEEPLRIESPPEAPKERTIRLQVSVDGPGAPVHGAMTLHLANTPPELAQSGVARQVEIRESMGRFECLTGESFLYDSAAIPGYWTEPGRITDGPEGDRMIGIRAFPAGSIAGRVIAPEGEKVGDGVKVKIAFDLSSPGGETFSPPPPPPSLAERGLMPMGAWLSFAHKPLPRPMTEEATTDAEGRFEIPRFPLGFRGKVVVESGRYFVHAGDVLLDAREPRATLEVRFPRKAAASVHLVDPEGRPVQGARLALSLYREKSPGWWPLGETDADGRLSVDGMAEGETNYKISVLFPTDYRPMIVPLTPGGPTLELRAEPGKILEGRVVEAVTGWPIPGLNLWARSDAIPVDIEAKTDADGRFRLTTLPDGPIVLDDRRSLKWLSPASKIVQPGSLEPLLIRLINIRFPNPQPRPLPMY